MNVEPYPIKTNDYKDDEITRVVMKHSNKGEYHTGFRDGRDVTLYAVLEIIDGWITFAHQTNGDMSMLGALRADVLKLKER